MATQGKTERISDRANNHLTMGASLPMDDLHVTYEHLGKASTLFKGGSALRKAIDAITSVMQSMKNTMWGAPWKAASRFIPLKLVDDNLQSIVNSLTHLSGPTQRAYELLPNIIDGIEQHQATGIVDAHLSREIGCLLQLLPSLHHDLGRLLQLVDATSKLLQSAVSGTDKLGNAKQFKKLAVKFGERLEKLRTSVASARTATNELSHTISRLMTWLPTYHTSIRKSVQDEKACQFKTSSFLRKATYCDQPVIWQDDEDMATCDRCGIYVCSQHRVEMPASSNTVARCQWLCLNCTRA